MKIALIGYGKMGKAIEKIALEKGHEIAVRAGRNGFTDEEIKGSDVAIDFSLPETAFENCRRIISLGIPVVSGTTGWLDKKPIIEQLAVENQTAFLYASNFSLGVNLFFAVNEYLAKLMAGHNYSVSMDEIHHTQKLDAPSGTAITLADAIINANDLLKSWTIEKTSKENELPIVVERVDPTPGTHAIHYDSEVDSIEIKHTAHSRIGFASGALLAAEWIQNKKGVFSMKDLLNL